MLTTIRIFKTSIILDFILMKAVSLKEKYTQFNLTVKINDMNTYG